MFNAPEIIYQIPDIKQIYDINEEQGRELDAALELLDGNLYLDTMDGSTVKRWERILKIRPSDSDTVDDRRFKVKSIVLDRIPYSYRVIREKLNALIPNGYELEILNNRTMLRVKAELESSRMINELMDFLEKILPLNMRWFVVMLSKYEFVTEEYITAKLRTGYVHKIDGTWTLDGSVHLGAYPMTEEVL